MATFVLTLLFFKNGFPHKRIYIICFYPLTKKIQINFFLFLEIKKTSTVLPLYVYVSVWNCDVDSMQ